MPDSAESLKTGFGRQQFAFNVMLWSILVYRGSGLPPLRANEPFRAGLSSQRNTHAAAAVLLSNQSVVVLAKHRE